MTSFDAPFAVSSNESGVIPKPDESYLFMPTEHLCAEWVLA